MLLSPESLRRQEVTYPNIPYVLVKNRNLYGQEKSQIFFQAGDFLLSGSSCEAG